MITISVAVANPNSSPATENVLLYINGVEADTREVTLSPGGSAEVAFTVSRDAPGIYNVAVGAEKGSFEIAIPETSALPEEEDESDHPFNWILLIAIIISVVVAAGGVIALLYFRRRA